MKTIKTLLTGALTLGALITGMAGIASATTTATAAPDGTRIWTAPAAGSQAHTVSGTLTWADPNSREL